MSEQTLIKEICPTTTRDWLADGALLLDVREVQETEALAFDVADMLHIPLSEFEVRYSEIPKDRPVVMACRSGARSLRAAGFLANHSYTNVVNMQHGMLRWAEKGFPVKGSEAEKARKGESDCCSQPGCC